MENEYKQETTTFLISSVVLCLLLAVALSYSNEMALALFGVIAYLLAFFSPCAWFLLSRHSDDHQRAKRANISLSAPSGLLREVKSSRLR